MLTPKGTASRNKLLASAEELFAQKGYHTATVSQIVQHAGLTQAAFYLYFKSKDEILQELLGKFGDQLREFSDAGSQVIGKTPEELEQHVIRSFTGLFKFLGHNANLTRIALQDNDGDASFRGTIVRQISENMLKNQQAGIVRSDVNPELAAESVVASVERLIYRYSATSNTSAEELGYQTGRLFLLGVLNHH